MIGQYVWYTPGLRFLLFLKENTKNNLMNILLGKMKNKYLRFFGFKIYHKI